MDLIDKKIPSVMISAPKSGSGKTTVTSAILGALVRSGKKVCPYKTGPDYIDTMLHSFITDSKSINLDSFMCDENTLKYLYARAFDGDIAVIEGAMGYYDGIGATYSASAYETANIIGTKTILVVEPKGMALSVAAEIKGFVDFVDNSRICGVILNNIRPTMYEFYKNIIENIGIKVYGMLPTIENASIKSRHLGLMCAEEIDDLQSKIEALAKAALEYIDIGGILSLAEMAEGVSYTPVQSDKKYDVTIAVAKDKAFCFYYEDNLKLLSELGAKIKYVSPLSDDELADVDGMYIGGGYPELLADKLAENVGFINSFKSAVERGMPVFAECGGFMYLLDELADRNGKTHKMCGIIDGKSVMGNKLCRFGYIQLTANEDNILCRNGETLKAHEFHYSDSTSNGTAFTAQKPNGRQWQCIYFDKNVCGGYPHIHFYSNIGAAERFVQMCGKYKNTRLNSCD